MFLVLRPVKDLFSTQLQRLATIFNILDAPCLHAAELPEQPRIKYADQHRLVTIFIIHRHRNKELSHAVSGYKADE